MGSRETIHQVTVTGPIALGDLRWLVEQCEGYSDDSAVSVQAYRELGPRDHDPDKITVRGKVVDCPDP